MTLTEPKAVEVRQVVAALIRRDGKLLVCQRTRHQAMPLKWEFPGGKVEPGEGAIPALIRELDEELGINAIIGPEVACVRHQYRTGTSVELHFFLVEQYEGELENRIFRDIQWASPRELLNYDFLEADLSLVRDLAAGKLL